MVLMDLANLYLCRCGPSSDSCDKVLHGGNFFQGGVEEFQLVAGTDKIVVRILCLVVYIPVEIVRKETDCLHEGEEAGGIGEILLFHLGEE